MATFFTPGDSDLLRKACDGDDATPALVEAICSCTSSADVVRIVQDRLLANDDNADNNDEDHGGGERNAAVFADDLARGLRKLRKRGGSGNERLVRAAGLCVSKALQSSTGSDDTASVALHRGLRQPALLLILAEIVRDNDAGSAAQRAAASALLAFCDSSPGLWKELAKEVRSGGELLESGFLKPVSALASIADHRTQELFFEAVYRLWKVWKKQRGGPPSLPPSTPAEIRDGLSSITIDDFEGQARAMLLTVNGNNDDDDGEEDRWTSPPSSFPVDALLQSTEWLGLGLSNRLGEAKWLDVGGDSISIQVQPRPSPAKQGGGCTPSSSRGGGGGGGVFVSIPAEAVATSSKVLVSMRSLQVEVSLSECPALTRLVCIPPSQTRAGARCTIVVQLQGGAKVFGRFRKAVAALTSKVARKPKERCSLASFQRNASASSRVEMQARSASRDSTVVAPTLRPAPATPAAAPPAAPTSGEVRDTPRKEEARIAGDKAEDGEDWKQPAATSGRHARNTRRAALVTPSEDAAGPAPAAAVSATVGNSRSSSSASSTGERNKKRRLVAGDSHFETVDATPAATGKASRGVDDGAAGSATITVGSIGSIRRIAEGTSIARSLRASHDAPGGGANVAAAAAADENDGDSWMEPRRHLDLAPAAAAAAATAKEKAARGARGGSCSGGGQVESGKAEGCGGTGQERGSAHGGGGRGGRSASSARGDGASERSGAGDIVPRGAGGRPPRREAALKAMQALSPVSSKSSQSSQSSSQGEGNDVGGRAGRSDIAARGTETPSEKSCFSIRGDDHDDDCDDRDNDEEEEEWDEAIVPAAESTAAADRAAALSTAKGKRPARGEGQRSGVAWDEGDSIPSASLGARAEGGTATSKHGYDQKGEESLEEPAQNSVEYSDEELSERSDGVVGGGRGTGAGGARGSGGGVLVSDGGDGNNDGGGGEEAGEEPGSEDVWEDYDHNDDEDEVEADEDEEDSIMLAQLYQQLVATSRAKAKRQKKRKAESSVGGARAECRDYLDRTAQKVKEHWRRQAHSLLEEARQAEEAVASAREVVKSLAAQHEAQWQATRGRMQKHASSLKRLEAQLSSGQDGPDAKMSELESEWQGGAEELQQKLQKHREAAVTRFSATITSNKKARKGQRGDAGAGGDNMATLLSHLTMRRTK